MSICGLLLMSVPVFQLALMASSILTCLGRPRSGSRSGPEAVAGKPPFIVFKDDGQRVDGPVFSTPAMQKWPPTPGNCNTEVGSINRNLRALLTTVEAAVVPKATVQNRTHSSDWLTIKGQRDFLFF